MRKERRWLRLTDVKLDAVVDQVANQTAIQVSGGRLDFFAVVGQCNNGSVFDGRLADALGFHFIEKIGVWDRGGTAPDAAIVKLFKHCKQNQRDRDPDGCFGKHIIHENSLNADRLLFNSKFYSQ